MENKIKFLIIPLVITALFLPNLASADMFGVMDYFSQALDAIEELASGPMGVWVRIFIYYVIGLILFCFTGSLLQWVLKLPLEDPGFISLSNNFVTNGWIFVSGLVNMSIILILLVIAFAYIFKIETFNAKKTFVSLIIIALLINFSLVFVKALVDISNIIYNAILKIVGVNILKDAFTTLFRGIWGFIITMGVSVLLVASSLLIPLAGPFVQYGILVVWIVSGYLFLPTMILQLILIFLFSSIFSLLFGLFVFRIFVIWILAVLSPVAFVCFVLPQTKKYWDEWLKYLLEWMFVGIFALFFLALGLKTIPSISNPPIGFVGVILIPGFLYYYFFLFVYLVLVLWLIKRFMPTFAQFLIGAATAAGGIMWASGIKPLGKGIGRRAGRLATKQAAEEAKAKADAVAAGTKYTPSFRMRALGLMSRPARLGYRLRGTTPEREASRDIEKKEAGLEARFGKDTKSAMEGGLPLGWKIIDPTTKAAMALYLSKMHGADEKMGLGRLTPGQRNEALRNIMTFVPHRTADAVKHMPGLIDDAEVGPLIQRTMVPNGPGDKDVQKLVGIGINPADTIRKAAFMKAVVAIKPTDIENLSPETLGNKDFQEMTARFKSPAFIQRIGEDKGQAYVDEIHQKANDLGSEEISKTNRALPRAAILNPGFRAIFSPLKGAETMEKLRIEEIIAGEKNVETKKFLKDFRDTIKERNLWIKKLAEATTAEEIEKIEKGLKKTEPERKALMEAFSQSRPGVLEEIERLMQLPKEGKTVEERIADAKRKAEKRMLRPPKPTPPPLSATRYPPPPPPPKPVPGAPGFIEEQSGLAIPREKEAERRKTPAGGMFYKRGEKRMARREELKAIEEKLKREGMTREEIKGTMKNVKIPGKKDTRKRHK